MLCEKDICKKKIIILLTFILPDVSNTRTRTRPVSCTTRNEGAVSVFREIGGFLPIGEKHNDKEIQTMTLRKSKLTLLFSCSFLFVYS